MKRIFVLIVILVIARFTVAQNVGINATGAVPDASAILDVASTSKGLLIPRVALTATNAAGPISSPTTSLLVYNTATAGSSPNNVVPGYYYWNVSSWIRFSSASNTAWTLTGNSGLNGATNFIGTTDDVPMIFKTNGNSFLEFGNRGTLGLTQGYTDYDNATEKITYVRSAMQFEAAGAQFYKPKMYTDADGNFRVKGSSAGTDYFEFGSTGTNNNGGFEFVIGDDGDEPMVFKSYHYINGMSEIMRLQSGRMAVGSNSFDATNPEKLLIDAGATSSYNLMTGKGSIDNYLQINVKNSSNTANASSDVVATSSNGSESVNYIDMGINSGAYTNTSYPMLAGANTAYLYATGNDFVIGNANTTEDLMFFTGGTAATNERMRINAAGNIGIGSTPSFKLDVNGTIRTGKASATNGSLVFSNSTNANTVTVNSSATSASYALSLPAAQGAASTVLVNNGSGTLSWSTVPAIGGTWSTLGNSGTTAGTNFLGTTDNQALSLFTNNTEKMRISATGDVGIGTSTFTAANPEQLLVNAGAPAVGTDFQNVIVGKGNTNNYAQLNIQNINAGTNASSDVVATADNGSELNNFVDLGINSSINSSGIMGGANDAYLYNLGQNFLIGTGTVAKSLIFMTGGTAQATNERVRVDGTGKMGIGTVGNTSSAVNSTLEVVGSAGFGIVTTSTTLTLDATNYTVIATGGTPTINFPAAAASNRRRIYVIVNQTGTARTTSAYLNFSAASTTTIAANSSITIQSDGTNWYRIQ